MMLFFKTSVDLESDIFIICHPAITREYMYIVVEIIVSFTFSFPTI